MARAHARFCSGACRAKAHRAGIPATLRKLDRWVVHTETKIPVTPKGRMASPVDPRTWSTWDEVRHFDRHGFVLNGDGIVCLDIDHCLVDGQLTDRAREILDRCPDTYTEVSMSGDGLHIFGRGALLQGRRLDGVEVYGNKRFIAMTGHRFGSCPSTLADLSSVLDWLLT